jgi:imidazolonepropionase-like amidohydrolase
MAKLLITAGEVVDPLNGRKQVLDVLIDGDQIAEVGPDIRVPNGAQVIDARGKLVMPGLVDTHVHTAGHYRKGYAMMARAGVTTALNLSGQMDDVLDGILAAGSGMTIASLDSLEPGVQLPSNAPSAGEIGDALDRALEGGAFGVKILGGHYPFTPDATAEIIHQANAKTMYVAFHVGSTATGSDLHGLREAAELADGNALHIAHVNSYCRGLVRDALDEAREAVEILTRWPRLRSESYLALINGTSGRCVNGAPASGATRNCLRLRGYATDEPGLEKALRDGYAMVLDDRGDESILLQGAPAHELWREMGTNVGLSFAINDPTSQFILATAKHADGRFVVDALSTDGGGIPRNTTLERGLALVELDALSISDFVVKSSLAPARMIGLMSKGHLSVAADADVIVVDRAMRRADVTVAMGTPIQSHGVLTASRGRVVTTADGASAVRAAGLPVTTIDTRVTGLYDRRAIESLATVRAVH